MNTVIINQDEPLDWEDSWKLSEAELESEDATYQTTSRIIDVFSPGWSNSWLFSAAPLNEGEERQKNWCCSCGYWQQIRWVNAVHEQKYFFYLMVPQSNIGS